MSTKKPSGVTIPPKKASPKPFQPRMRDPESGAPMRRGRPVATANAKPGLEPPDRKLPGVTWAKQPMVTPRAEAARQDNFEQLFGSWDSGDEDSADNERIDADLAREYADPHEPGV